MMTRALPHDETLVSAKRLRQLHTVSGRGLLGSESESTAAPAHYITLSARRPDSDCRQNADAWQLLYRSEAVAGTLNPEWMPLSWDDGLPIHHDPLLEGTGVHLLLAVHAVDKQSQPVPSSKVVAKEPRECSALSVADDLQHPLTFSAGQRPAFQLLASEQGGSWTGRPASGEVGQSPLPALPRQQRAEPAQPTEQSEHEIMSDSTLSVEQQQQQQNTAKSEAQAQQADASSIPISSQHNGTAATDREEESRQTGSQQAVTKSSCLVSNSVSTQRACLNVAAAAALASTGCCPGHLTDAWQLQSISELCYAGTNLATLQLCLQPNTLVLQFEDGLYLWPPPMQAVQPSSATSAAQSLHVSPLKPGLSQLATAGHDEDALDASPPALPGATRRFANLLVSKLLRSGTSLHEPGAHGSSASLAAAEAGMSDVESDAESEASQATGASRRAASEALGSKRLAAGAAGWTATAGGARSAHSTPVKTLTMAGAQQYIASLAALRGRLQDVAGRAETLRQQLQERLGPHKVCQQQHHTLQVLQAEATQLRERAAAARVRLEEVRSETAAAKKLAMVRAQALITTLKVMQATSRRIGEAEGALRGEKGRGTLVAVLRELIARRCHMVCQLGAIFQLGPTAVSIPEAPPGGYLEDRLDQQWAGAAPAAAAQIHVQAWSNGRAGAQGSSSKYREEMRLSIGGLEVDPSVWRKAFEGGGYGYEWDEAEDRAAGVALGYVAQMVDRLAAYLDVPLRYPLVFCGSRSRVVDSYPPLGNWSPDVAERRSTLFGRGDAAAPVSGAGDRAPVEYPLYCDSNRERPRFAVGVFLLNKDVIQLLQAHGISAAGPNQLLQNLYKLLLAAQSALPSPHLARPPAALLNASLGAALSHSG